MITFGKECTVGTIIHKITDTIRAITGKKDRLEPTTAIIVASGSSSRMGEGISKQMIMLDDMPVVARTIKAFDECECIDEIIVVAKADEIELYNSFSEKYGIKKPLKIIEGGETRQVFQDFSPSVDFCDNSYIELRTYWLGISAKEITNSYICMLAGNGVKISCSEKFENNIVYYNIITVIVMPTAV